MARGSQEFIYTRSYFKRTAELVIGLVLILLLLLAWWVRRSIQELRVAQPQSTQSNSEVTPEWVERYMTKTGLTEERLVGNVSFQNWVDQKALEVVRSQALEGRSVVNRGVSGSSLVTQPALNILNTFVTENTPMIAGEGIVIENGVIKSTFGSQINSADIAEGGVTFSNLGLTGCTSNQVLKFDGTSWACGADLTSAGSSVTGDTNRLAVFSSSTDLSDSYLMQDSEGLWVDSGKSLHVQGVVYGDGSGLTNLSGTQLSPGSVNSGTLATNSVGSGALQDDAVTDEDIADGTISFEKFGQNGCSSGSVIKWDGLGWQCGDDTVGQAYSAGSGLTLSGGTFSLNLGSSNTWSGTQLFNNGFAIGGNIYSNLAGAGLVFSGGTLSASLGSAVENSEISDAAVSTQKLAEGSVTGTKIADGSIMATDIAEGAITGSLIADNTISSLNLVDGAVSTTQLADNSITSSKLRSGIITNAQVAVGAIESDAILNGTILEEDLAAGSITSTSILDGTITASDIASGAITSTLIADGSITADKLGVGSVDGGKVLDGSIKSEDIANGTLTFAKLGANDCLDGQIMKLASGAWSCAADDASLAFSAGTGLTISGGVLSLDTNYQNTWTGLQTFNNGIKLGNTPLSDIQGNGLVISSGTLSVALGTNIETAEITDGAVTAAKLANNAIDSAKIIDGTVGATDLGVGAVTTDKLSDDSITGAKIANNTISTEKVVDEAVTTSKLGSGAVATDKIANGAVTFAKLSQSGCQANQVIKWGGSSWTCANDATGAAYAAGTGLNLSGGAFSLDTSAANSWNATQTFGGGFKLGTNIYANLTGNGLAFSGGTLSATLGTTIESSEITDGTIVAADIADGAVTSAKILDGTIGADDLASNSITSAKILDGTITSADLATGAITTSQLADASVLLDKMSTAARKRTSATDIGTITASVLVTLEQPIFVAPTNGTITKVTFTTSNGITAAINNGTLSVRRRTATAGTVASIPLASASMSAYVPVAPTLNAGTSFATGDVYSFRYDPGILGVTVGNLLITIEYIASE